MCLNAHSWVQPRLSGWWPRNQHFIQVPQVTLKCENRCRWAGSLVESDHRAGTLSCPTTGPSWPSCRITSAGLLLTPGIPPHPPFSFVPSSRKACWPQPAALLCAERAMGRGEARPAQLGVPRPGAHPLHLLCQRRCVCSPRLQTGPCVTLVWAPPLWPHWPPTMAAMRMAQL